LIEEELIYVWSHAYHNKKMRNRTRIFLFNTISDKLSNWEIGQEAIFKSVFRPTFAWVCRQIDVQIGFRDAGKPNR